jgi:PleD family two-component response regulator
MSSKAQQQRGKDADSQTQKDKEWAGARRVETPEPNKIPFLEKRPKVLIVDDSSEIREYLSRLLEKQFSITTAVDGRACLNKASAEPPNCIVTDINMPHLNGIDTIKCLRRDPQLTHIPTAI